MKGSLTVELSDRPGQLTKIITPLAESGCNILNIQHNRTLSGGDKVSVEIHFQTEDKSKVDRIIENLEKEGIVILKYSPDIQTYRETVILIGHVFTTDITDTLIKIMTYGIKVASVDARITLMEEVSSVKMQLQSNSKEKLADGINLLKEICKEKNLFLIRTLND
ncbi:MAG: ACT domain-containing protein [Candidatus Odinarchaeia archaeon]